MHILTERLSHSPLPCSSGNKIWSDALEWTHGPEFRDAKLRDWTVDGKVAGQVKKAKNLTFMTIDGVRPLPFFDLLFYAKH